jgi:hypothetical protein
MQELVIAPAPGIELAENDGAKNYRRSNHQQKWRQRSAVIDGHYLNRGLRSCLRVQSQQPLGYSSRSGGLLVGNRFHGRRSKPQTQTTARCEVLERALHIGDEPKKEQQKQRSEQKVR